MKISRLSITLCFLSMILAAGNGFAGSDKILESIGSCTKSASRVLRLICYDNLAVSLGVMSPEQHKTESEILGTIGLWESAYVVNSVGKKMYYFKLLPEGSVAGRSSDLSKPELVIKCEAQQTQFYVDWKMDMSNPLTMASTIYMGIKIDDSSSAQDWSLSMDKMAAFMPTPVEFLRDLNGKSTLLLQFTTQQGVQNLKFDIKGLDQILQKVVENCYQ
jgi:hypothetical protein